MRLYKNDVITLRVNPALKSKFNVAIGFLDISAVLSGFMQEYVRNFEKDFGRIPTVLTKDETYDIVTKIYGIRLSKKKFEELNDAYPKTRKNKAIYGSVDD